MGISDANWCDAEEARALLAYLQMTLKEAGGEP